MPHFHHDGLRLAYMDEGADGEGEPILLVHGFASNMAMNWIGPGWVAHLQDLGRRVIAFDHRGHGASDKPHDPEAYRPQRMAADAVALLDHLNVPSAVWIGYSMGARVSAFAALSHPERVRALVLGGLGLGLVTGLDDAAGIRDALLAAALDDVTGERPRMFRAFADKTGSDRVALAACIATSRDVLSADVVARIAQPTLIAVGTRDDLAGSPHELAALMPRATALDIPNREHLPATGDPVFKRGVAAFLSALASEESMS